MEYRTDPLGDGVSCLEYIDHLGDDERVVRAARVSYARDLDPHPNPARLLRYLLKHGHWSPFEHVVVSLHVSCPLFVARQWMRHKSWAFNEVSRRYTSEDLQFYTLAGWDWRAQSPDNRQASEFGDFREQGWDFTSELNLLIAHAQDLYEELLEKGVAREQARMVLPQNLYTRFYATASLRSLLHFLQTREHEGAQWEIQQYAQSLRDLLTQLFPLTLKEWSQLRSA